MKKIILNALLVLGFTLQMNAQKIAVVDINAVLQSMSTYTEAERQVDAVAAEWRQEIAEKYDEIKSLYNKYQAEQVLLSEDAKTQRENEIVDREKEVRELQKRRFGPDGDLFQKRAELVSPVQDKVFFEIEDYAADRGYDIILDKSSAAGILFTSKEFDKTEDIIKRVRK